MKVTGWSTWKKVLFGLGCVVGVLSLVGHYWWQALNANPVVTIPTPTLPSPNAYDYYVKACAAMVNQNQVDDAMVGLPARGQVPAFQSLLLTHSRRKSRWSRRMPLH